MFMDCFDCWGKLISVCFHLPIFSFLFVDFAHGSCSAICPFRHPNLHYFYFSSSRKLFPFRYPPKSSIDILSSLSQQRATAPWTGPSLAAPEEGEGPDRDSLPPSPPRGSALPLPPRRTPNRNLLTTTDPGKSRLVNRLRDPRQGSSVESDHPLRIRSWWVMES